MKPKHQDTDWLPFRVLRFDARYQKQLIPAKVKQLRQEWNIDSVGVITVSIRHDRAAWAIDGQTAWVIDGQHRVHAALGEGLGDTKALCHVYRNLTIEEEARKFLDLNNAKSVTGFDRYRAGLVAKDPICLGVQATLERYGLGIAGQARADGYVACVAQVLALYERDPQLLDQVCGVLSEAWGTRAAAWERVPVAAMGLLLGRFNGEVDHAVLSKKLSKYRGGPGALQGDAKGLAGYRPITLTRAAAEIIRDTYNKSRREGALLPL